MPYSRHDILMIGGVGVHVVVMKAARGHHEGADGEGHIVRPCAILAPVTAVRDDRAALIEIAAIITIRAEIESDVNVPV